jgi:DNA transformation protein
MRISEMRNLGPAMERWLSEVGIGSEEDLRRNGAARAYHKLKFRFGRAVNRNALHAMEAALMDCGWRDLDAAAKARLTAEVEALATPGAQPASGPYRPASRRRR